MAAHDQALPLSAVVLGTVCLAVLIPVIWVDEHDFEAINDEPVLVVDPSALQLAGPLKRLAMPVLGGRKY